MAQSTNGLVLKNYKTQKTFFVKEGTKVKIKKEGKTLKGAFKVVSDHAILIKTDTLQINQIQGLSAKTSSSIIGGTALLIPSSLIGGSGLVLTIAGIASLSDYGLIGIIFGAPIAALGTIGVISGIKLLSNGKKFQRSKWEYTIVLATPLEAEK